MKKSSILSFAVMSVMAFSACSRFEPESQNPNFPNITQTIDVKNYSVVRFEQADDLNSDKPLRSRLKVNLEGCLPFNQKETERYVGDMPSRCQYQVKLNRAACELVKKEMAISDSFFKTDSSNRAVARIYPANVTNMITPDQTTSDPCVKLADEIPIASQVILGDFHLQPRRSNDPAEVVDQSRQYQDIKCVDQTASGPKEESFKSHAMINRFNFSLPSNKWLDPKGNKLPINAADGPFLVCVRYGNPSNVQYAQTYVLKGQNHGPTLFEFYASSDPFYKGAKIEPTKQPRPAPQRSVPPANQSNQSTYHPTGYGSHFSTPSVGRFGRVGR